MAKRAKRVTSLPEDWLEAEASLIPTHCRRSQILGTHQKEGVAVSKKFRPRLPAPNGRQPGPAAECPSTRPRPSTAARSTTAIRPPPAGDFAPCYEGGTLAA